MLADKSNGTLWRAMQDALLADEASQDARVDAGCAAHSAAYDGTIATRDSANSASYRAMLHDIKDGIAHKLAWKLAMWNAETYVIEVHPYSERAGMFPICWRYREPIIDTVADRRDYREDPMRDTGHIIWGGLCKNSDGHYSSHQ